MRRPLIAGNWKMNLTRDSAVALAGGIVAGAARAAHVDLAVCPPSVYLEAVGRVVRDSAVALGAQNVYHEPAGAFTGEISASMLVDLGCQYVIVGHSERRHVMGESDQDVNRKMLAALAAGLRPILCTGELLAERQAGSTNQVVGRQLHGALAGIDADRMAAMTIAYEPVWAIGTGKVATTDQAEAVHAEIRQLLQDRYSAEVASTVQILYGGSVKPDNAGSLLEQPNIDGALVGGASLEADSFLAIARAAPG